MQPHHPWIIPLAPGDSPAEIAAKAAAVTPHPRQLSWQQQELTAFVHFGVNTFSGREWGSGLEDPASFHPTALDASAWVNVLAECGFRSVILTAKHHDGFCLWPSRYTDFSVKASPWRGGQGDVLGELAAAVHTAGLRLGVYLSPADLHEMEAPGGRYGNGSVPVERAIPTLLPGDTRQPPRLFSYTADDYNAYYLNQLYELLTEYGAVHEVWFDGANPKPGAAETYDYAGWFALVRALAPDAVMFNGPDVRWVGNESGLAREDEWSVLPFQGDPSTGTRPLDPLQPDLGSRARLLEGADYLAWYPAEVDVSIRPGWFYHAEEDEQVKSVAQLMEIYEQSVGRNGVLLLNIPPDRRGLFADTDTTRLREFAAEVRRVYGVNLAAQPIESALHSGGQTCWQPPQGASTGAIIFDLTAPVQFDRVSVAEWLPLGQRVEGFAVDAWLGDGWVEIGAGSTVGYRRILPVKATTTQRVRLRITAARACPAIAGFGLHNTSG